MAAKALNIYSMDPVEVGKRVRQLRSDRGMTQRRLADALGVTSDTVSRIELGKHPPSRDTLDGLSRIFGVPIDWMMYGDDVIHERESHVSVTDLNELNLRLQSSESLNAFLVSTPGRTVTHGEYAELIKATRMNGPPTDVKSWEMLLKFVRAGSEGPGDDLEEAWARYKGSARRLLIEGPEDEPAVIAYMRKRGWKPTRENWIEAQKAVVYGVDSLPAETSGPDSESVPRKG